MNIEDYALKSMKEYTSHVASSRVLPGIDGLKPVHRRVIYSLLDIGARPNKGFRKTSTVIGQCMLYHPHGEASINGAISSLISSPNPLLAGRGNWGSVLGDPISAPRYNEVRTSDLFEEVFDPFCQKIGNFVKNYDESTVELSTFQSKVPLNYLIGVSGIGVGFTVANPAYHIECIKDLVIRKVKDRKLNDLDYGYGAIHNTTLRRIEPKIRPIKLNGKDWIEITEIPISSSLSIINNDKYISELRQSGQIEMIIDISVKNFGIKMWAPKEVIEYVLMKSSIIPRDQEMYFYKRLRTTGFLAEWVKERKAFTKKKLYYEKVIEFHKNITDEAVNSIALTKINSDFQTKVTEIAEKVFDKYGIYPTGCEPFAMTKPEFVASILAKPIGSIKPKTVGSLVIAKVKADDVNEFIVDEVWKINEKLFSPKSVKQVSTMAFDSAVKIKRYVVIKNDVLSVLFTKTPRFHNYEVIRSIYVFFEDGSYELVPDKFTGEYTSEKPIVGFGEHKSNLFIQTVSGKLYVYRRFGSIKEPVLFVAPAKKIIVDDVEYTTEDNLYFDSFTKYKVIE